VYSGVLPYLENLEIYKQGGPFSRPQKVDDLFPFFGKLFFVTHFLQLSAQIRLKGGHPPVHLSSSPSKKFSVSQRGRHGTMAPHKYATDCVTSKIGFNH
jgi:hypothetical protein